MSDDTLEIKAVCVQKLVSYTLANEKSCRATHFFKLKQCVCARARAITRVTLAQENSCRTTFTLAIVMKLIFLHADTSLTISTVKDVPGIFFIRCGRGQLD